MAGGLIHNFGTMTKPLHAGMTARDGIMAAQLAGMGLTSGQQVLEHPVGFANTVLGEGTYDLNEIVQALGNPFHTQDDLMIKKYPACGGNHGMLDSILGLMREHEFDYKDVESLDVDQSFLSVVMLYREPEDELKGKFSVLYNAASALVDGEVGIDTFTAEKIRDPRVQETMAKVNLNVRSRWDEGSSEVKGATPVRIRLKDGRVLEHATPRQDILGHQNNPWGMDGITGKFRVNARLALSDEAVERAIETWSDVARVEDVGEAVKTLVA